MATTVGAHPPTTSHKQSLRQAFELVGVDEDGSLILPDGQAVFKSYTWAELQLIPAAPNLNRKVFVTDIGINGSEWVSNGTSWRPLNPIVLVAMHEPEITTDASTDETDVFVYNIPAGLLSQSSLLRIYPAWTFPSSATTKEVKVYVGGGVPFSKSRTTTTHEVPIVEMMTTDSASNAKFLLNPSGTYGSGQSGVLPTSSLNLNDPIQIRATSRWGTAGTGTNSITFHRCVVVLEY